MAITDLTITNQAISKLVGTINNTDDPVTFSLTPGDGNLKYPALSGAKYFYFLAIKSDKTYEIMRATTRTGDSITAARAQQGTSKLSFTAGDAIIHVFTAQDYNDVIAAFASYLPKAGGTMTGTLTLAADPANPLDAATKQYADAIDRATTGDVKLTVKTTADSGWVLMNDGSIGDGSSGATTRANADTSALFTLLWNNTANTDVPVSGGRGASAAADFAAHKTLTLPKSLGRVLGVYGSGSGLTARALGAAVGAETNSHTHVAGTLAGALATTLSFEAGVNRYGANVAGSAPVTISGSTGTPSSSTVMQPTGFLNAMIKL